MGRLIAVGDIHGQYTQLKNLMDKLALGKGDEIYFLGDYVDYGPQSADVLEYLIGLHKYRRAWFILGNHDAWFLDFLEHGVMDPAWWYYGGDQTVASYGGKPVPASHVEFLRMASKPIKHRVPLWDREYIFSHGFLCPTKAIEGRFEKDDALWGRPSTFGLNRLTGDFPEKCGWQDNQFLVAGHTIVDRPTFFGDRALVIDTGAKTGRPLTAAICPQGPEEEWEFVQA